MTDIETDELHEERTMNETDKKKKGLPAPRGTGRGYLALALMTALCVWCALSIREISRYPFPRQGHMLYPLIVLIRREEAWCLFSFILLGGMGLAMFYALTRRVNPFAILVCVPVSLVAAAWIALSLLFAPAILPVQTLSYQGHVYHLVVTYMKIDADVGTGAYVVVECDSVGLMCRYDVTPYAEMEGRWYEPDKSKTNENAVLFVDEADQALKLRVGDDVYGMEDDAFLDWAGGVDGIDIPW